MSKHFFCSFIQVLLLALLIPCLLAGCSHSKTSRGHLFRGDWAFEYNRTPWIGLPPDSGCPEESEGLGGGLLDCLKKDNDKERKGFRRHCGMNAQCTAQNPCCRTLGCGMWINPSDPATMTALGGTAKACGLTPFCSPQKPCRLTPNCGKPINVNINPQTLLASQQNPLGTSGNVTMSNSMLPNNMLQSGNNGTIRGMSPNTIPNTMSLDAMGNPVAAAPGGMPGGVSGTLVSRGIVPGASQITTGGLVTAIGVSTPAGTMTPIGVRLANGMVSNGIVLRACTMTPNCTAAHPCGLTPNCGGAVAVNLVSNNAVALASALQTQGSANGVMQAGGMGMLVNPVTNQPINGLTMGGYAQAGYPPIGYAPTGYAPGYSRFAPGSVDTGEQIEEEAIGSEETGMTENRSAMPVPRFRPIPFKPAFQRSEGMIPTPKSQRSLAKPTTTAMNEPQVSEEDLETALDQAYLEGVSAAMSEVERKLELKRQAAAKAKLEQKILQQAENVEEGLEEQEQLRQLALAQERKLRQQQAARMQPASLIAETTREQPTALPMTKTIPKVAVNVRPQIPVTQQIAQQSAQQLPALAKSSNTKSSNTASPAMFAKNLRTSVVNKMNDVLAPLLAGEETGQSPSAVQPRSVHQSSTRQAQIQMQMQEIEEVAVTPPNLPGKPSVLPMKSNYGLLPDDTDSPIQQARFNEDGR